MIQGMAMTYAGAGEMLTGRSRLSPHKVALEIKEQAEGWFIADNMRYQNVNPHAWAIPAAGVEAGRGRGYGLPTEGSWELNEQRCTWLTISHEY